MKKTILISDIKPNLFVRKALNMDHVSMLANIMRIDKEKLPDPVVNQDKVLIDGRHRTAAAKSLGWKEIEVEIVNVTDEVEMISMAFKANDGGSLPPTDADKEHTIEMLIDRDESHHAIAKLLGLDLHLVRHYVKGVKSRMSAKRMLQARSAVGNKDMTVTKAAEAYKVDIHRLRRHVRGVDGPPDGIRGIRNKIKQSHKSLSMKNAYVCSDVLDRFDDGILTEKQAINVFDYIESLQTNHAELLKGWRDRFGAKINSKVKA